MALATAPVAGGGSMPGIIGRPVPCTLRAMNAEEVARLIRAGLPDAEVIVRSEDDTHFAARIIAREFVGKRSIARHQLVYRTLGERMGRDIHALSIEALTPEEAGQD